MFKLNKNLIDWNSVEFIPNMKLFYKTKKLRNYGNDK